MRQSMRRRQIKWTIIVFVLLAGVLYIGRIPYDQILRDEVRTRHTQLMKTADILTREKLRDLIQDVHRLAQKTAITEYLEAPTIVRRSIMQRALIDTSNAYARYARIRYIDRTGMEQLRVNYAPHGAYSVASTALQDKSQSDYVREGMALEPGEMYLSPMALNVEHGRLERPLKPTLRLVRRVANSQGEPRGMLVLNYSADQLLARLRALFPELDRPMLLNRDGYWLLSPDADDAWGWLLERPHNTLKEQRPALWEKIQASPGGMAEIDGDLYSYARLDIGEFDAPTPVPRTRERQAGDIATNIGTDTDSATAAGPAAASAGASVQPVSTPDPWIMLVQTRYAQWHVGAAYLRPWFRAFVVGLFVMAAMLVYFVIAAREQRRLAREAERRQLAEFKDLYDNAPIGYVTLAASGMITNVNHALLASLGRQRDELLSGYYLTDLVSDESRQVLNNLLYSLGEGEHMQCRLDMRCNNGDLLTVLCSVSSLLSAYNTLMVGRCSVQDISQQVTLEQSLERLAYSDPLTRLANRRYFDELASREIQRLQREGGTLTALALDIDHFKAVNDSCGHDAGDEVLKSLADICHSRLRGSDILARFGGEEFTILLPGANAEEGRVKAETLRRTLANAPVVPADGDSIHYTVSIGVAVLEWPDEAQLPALLKQADRALYQAKQSGRNRVCVAE